MDQYSSHHTNPSWRAPGPPYLNMPPSSQPRPDAWNPNQPTSTQSTPAQHGWNVHSSYAPRQPWRQQPPLPGQQYPNYYQGSENSNDNYIPKLPSLSATTTPFHLHNNQSRPSPPYQPFQRYDSSDSYYQQQQNFPPPKSSLQHDTQPHQYYQQQQVTQPPIHNQYYQPPQQETQATQPPIRSQYYQPPQQQTQQATQPPIHNQYYQPPHQETQQVTQPPIHNQYYQPPHQETQQATQPPIHNQYYQPPQPETQQIYQQYEPPKSSAGVSELYPLRDPQLIAGLSDPNMDSKVLQTTQHKNSFDYPNFKNNSGNDLIVSAHENHQGLPDSEASMWFNSLDDSGQITSEQTSVGIGLEQKPTQAEIGEQHIPELPKTEDIQHDWNQENNRLIKPTLEYKEKQENKTKNESLEAQSIYELSDYSSNYPIVKGESTTKDQWDKQIYDSTSKKDDIPYVYQSSPRISSIDRAPQHTSIQQSYVTSVDQLTNGPDTESAVVPTRGGSPQETAWGGPHQYIDNTFELSNLQMNEPPAAMNRSRWGDQLNPVNIDTVNMEYNMEHQSIGKITSNVMMSEIAEDEFSSGTDFNGFGNMRELMNSGEDDLKLPWTMQEKDNQFGPRELTIGQPPESCPTLLQEIPITSMSDTAQSSPAMIPMSSDTVKSPTSDITLTPCRPPIKTSDHIGHIPSSSVLTPVESPIVDSKRPFDNRPIDIHSAPPLPSGSRPSYSVPPTPSTFLYPLSLQPTDPPLNLQSTDYPSPIGKFPRLPEISQSDMQSDIQSKFQTGIQTTEQAQIMETHPASRVAYSNPFDIPPNAIQSTNTQTESSVEHRQMKETAFYSGAHPALRGGQAHSFRPVLPPIGPPRSQQQNDIPTGYGEGGLTEPKSNYPDRVSSCPQFPSTTDTPFNHHRHQNITTEGTPDFIHDRHSTTHQQHPGTFTQRGPVPKPPGQYVDIAIGIQGRAFVFNIQGQPVDLPVILATARSLSVTDRDNFIQSNESGQLSLIVLEGLRGHQGPLLEQQMDHVNRLIDFYIEQKYQSLIKGLDKDILLWLLVRHIGSLKHSPSHMTVNEILGFLSDCSLLSEYLNLIDDQLPKLPESVSFLPSSLINHKVPPPSNNSTPSQPPSTAWADFSRRICSGQAAEAVDFAVNFGMFGHAFSASLLVSSDCFNAVRVSYAASLNPFGQPQRPQYWIKQSETASIHPSGRPFEAVHLDCVRMLFFLHALPPAIYPQDVEETETKLRDFLRKVTDLSSTWLTRLRVTVSYLTLDHPNCRIWIRVLGHELIDRQEIAIGHCCLILSGLLPCRDFGLLGCPKPNEYYAECLNDFGVVVDFDWKHFQLTEFFERVLVSVLNRNDLDSHLLLPKFLYSRILRIAEHDKMADRYLSCIKPPPQSILCKAIEQECPSHYQMPPRDDHTNSGRLGHGFGFSALIRNFLTPDE